MKKPGNTPERIQAKQRAEAAAKFCNEMVATVRKRLFQDVSDKLWWQHVRTVRQAVMEPARYLQERGAALPASRYRQILMTVVIAIEEHADRSQIRRMAIYFLKAVQEHMLHQGDTYYEEAKTPRNISLMLNPALKAMQSTREAGDTTAALAASAAVLAQKGGRKKAKLPKSSQPELF